MSLKEISFCTYHVQCGLKKTEETGQVEGKKSGSTADKQYFKVMLLRNRKKIQ